MGKILLYAQEFLSIFECRYLLGVQQWTSILEYTVYICLILYFYSVTQFFLAFSEVFYVIFLDFSFPILIFLPQRSQSLKMDNATDPDKTGAHFNFPILGEIFQLSFLPAVQEVLSNLRKILTI